MGDASNWLGESAIMLFPGAGACEDELLETLDSAVSHSRVKQTRAGTWECLHVT